MLAAGRAWRETGPFGFDYCDPAGLPVLRNALADYLQAARGLLGMPVLPARR